MTYLPSSRSRVDLRRQTVAFDSCNFEILVSDGIFMGLGAIHIQGTQVRSGRLPLRVSAQTFNGQELLQLNLRDVECHPAEIRLRLQALFRPLPVKLLRDHSFDPVHETGDWDEHAIAGAGQLDLVIRPETDEFGGARFKGFSYHYEYSSEDTPLFYLLDQASWELDGDIAGSTIISQSACSPPVVRFNDDTAWSTEGVMHGDSAYAAANATMTHNLPRWASHQAFDFQFKADKTLLGVFEQVDLIRTVLKRDAGKPELKTFDKYLFDESLHHRTPAKKILLNAEPKTETAQRNLWTRVLDEVHDRARAEFGLAEEPLVPRLCHDYWRGFVIDDYHRDLLPAAIELGFQAIFVDNLNKSAETERCPHEDFHWNMCCGHEYEVAPRLGGVTQLKRFVNTCRENGIRAYAWTNNDQALSSPVNAAERDDKGWFVRMEDARLKYGGAYTNVFSILNMKKDEPRKYWVEALKNIDEETGLNGYLFDSFYNLGFMPVDYSEGKPTTQWRELLGAFKELQDAGISFLIESLGPFGSPQHGCHSSFGDKDNLFAAYKTTVAMGYSTIPSGKTQTFIDEAEAIYRFFAHMASPSFPLFLNGVRLDATWTENHKRALADYNENHIHMHTRFLQEDGRAVLWHDAAAERATLWNFVAREVALTGVICDMSSGRPVPCDENGRYLLDGFSTYSIMGAPLPCDISI